MTDAAAPLAGQVAVVTGAGSKEPGLGTGKATALRCGAAGASVVVVDRHGDRADATVAQIRAEGGEATAAVVDLAGDETCEHVVAVALATYGRVDVLVNNAARFEPLDLLATTPAHLARIVDVNLTVPFMLCRAAVPHMVEQGGGSIVNIASIVAMRGASPPAYAATKAALIGLTTCLANVYGPSGVRVNCIAPGVIDTPMRNAAVAGAPEDSPQPRVIPTALGTEGDAWDIAHAVLYLASPAARHVTGVLLPVDGGATIRLA